MVVSVVGCGGFEVAYEVRPTVGVEVMGVVGMPLVAATSRTRICTKTTQVRNNKRVDTVEHMKRVMVVVVVVVVVAVAAVVVVTVVVTGRGVISQSRVNKSWFAM